jgi:hypothetical protein
MFKHKLIIIFLAATLTALPNLVFAHCDTMDGPVVKAAQVALSRGDITPVLKWIKPADESELRRVFDLTLTVRSKGEEAQQLADQYFFETLVRLHRAGEGAPYTGLKPSGEQEPIIVAADKALETGQSAALVKQVSTAITEGIAHRFAKVSAARKTADENVAAGREFVEAYVNYVHFVEHVYQTASGGSAEHEEHQAEHTR